MIIDEVATNARRKRIVRRTAYLFIAVMLLLTFLSSTINNLGLIRVEPADVKSGSLTYQVEKQAVVTPVNIYDIYLERESRINTLHAKSGQKVKKGQLLAELDVRDLEEEIKTQTLELENKKAETELMLQKFEVDREGNEKALADAQKDLSAASELYEAGGGTFADVEKLRKVCDAADRDYRKLLEEKKADLTIKQNEAKAILQKINALKLIIKKSAAVYSPMEGYIWEMNVQEGAPAGTSKPVFRIAGSGGVCVKFTVDTAKGKNLAAGDTMTVTVPSLKNKSIKAEISTIKPTQSENGVEITASVNKPELKGGEMINISIKKESELYDCIIPNSAVRTDDSGRKFAYVVKERKSSLGKEYYLQKAFLYVAASNQNETAIESGLSFLEKVVTKSDRPVMAGDRVKIYKE